MYLVQGFYMVSYGLGIYILNLFIEFLSPQVDPEIHSLSSPDNPFLPTRGSDKFCPFVRRLPKLKFWQFPHLTVKLLPLRSIPDCPVCVCRNAFKFCESVSGQLSLKLMGGWVDGWNRRWKGKGLVGWCRRKNGRIKEEGPEVEDDHFFFFFWFSNFFNL
ncbi:protein RER1A-like [Pyrus ussuriensis x Pyrus communis]|uniref:Protein RER1A-like n=1 Tax=Pyrus ussuriensis x Pyrus communis TaxID=2448454 RepID=A0A5N5HWJ9_9ROSA|nr:protein RER1A-like [Pyrus ussuriensis x Pyrus communis]